MEKREEVYEHVRTIKSQKKDLTPTLWSEANMLPYISDIQLVVRESGIQLVRIFAR
jgi:hypothetical protein